MAVNEFHKDDIGTVFEITLKDQDSTIVDLSSATTKQIRFAKPDGTVEVQEASFKTDGTDGILTYTTIADDLDLVGRWFLQAYVDLGSEEWSSDTYSFEVHPNLE